MTTSAAVPPIVQDKLAAFEQLQPEFELCFQFVQDVHGEKRFAVFPVSATVRYLHALWVCDCKGRLLSVSKTVKEYEGGLCLQLLRDWQAGDTAQVVDFLQHKLDMLPMAQITRQLHEARQNQQDDLTHRLEHGRLVLLNRGMNLMQAYASLFAFTDENLLLEVHEACVHYGHLPEQIEQQLTQMDMPLYTYVPHQVLAQRNMRVMNMLGVNVTAQPADRPGHRSWRVLEPTVPPGPYAQQVIEGYQELTTPTHNNLKQDPFVDRPEQNGSEVV